MDQTLAVPIVESNVVSDSTPVIMLTGCAHFTRPPPALHFSASTVQQASFAAGHSRRMFTCSCRHACRNV